MFSSTVAELMRGVEARGIRIWATAGKIRFSPRAAMTTDLRGLLREHKAEVLAALQAEASAEGGRAQRSPSAIETAAILPESSAPGDPPLRGCYACDGREFHKVTRGPEWICGRCHPAHAGLVVAETWTAPAPSLWESIRERNDRWRRFNVRGMEKRGRRPGRDGDAGGQGRG